MRALIVLCCIGAFAGIANGQDKIKVEYVTKTFTYPETVMRTVEYKVPVLVREKIVREIINPEPVQRVYVDAVPTPTPAAQVTYTPVVAVRGMTVAQHLKSDPHYLSASLVDSLTIDQQYRLHDSLHGQGRVRSRSVNRVVSRPAVRRRFFLRRW